MANGYAEPPYRCRDARIVPCGPVDVHLVPFAPQAFEFAWFSHAGIDVPPAIRSSVAKRQAEYFHGRLATRLALEPFGLGLEQVGTGPSREPLWPEGHIGSISHTSNLAGAAVQSQDFAAGLGIDIENVIQPSYVDVLNDTVLSTQERHYLDTLTHACALRVLQTLVFSAKESFFKAAFASVRRYFDFDAVSVIRIDLPAAHLVLRVEEPLSAGLQPGRQLPVSFVRLHETCLLTACVLEGGRS